MNSKNKQTVNTSHFHSLQRFANSISGDITLLLWSFAEAICWFILPDFLLLILAILAPQKTLKWVLLSIIGSLTGTIVLITLLHWLPINFATIIFRLPFTHIGMLTKVEHFIQSYGHISILLQPFSGIPSKVWTYDIYQSPHWHPWLFLLLLTLARGTRMMLIGGIGYLVSKRIPTIIQRYWLFLLVLYTVLFLIFLSITSR